MTPCKRSQRKRQGKYLIIEQIFHEHTQGPDLHADFMQSSEITPAEPGAFFDESLKAA
jgi:hypothetical protein